MTLTPIQISPHPGVEFTRAKWESLPQGAFVAYATIANRRERIARVEVSERAGLYVCPAHNYSADWTLKGHHERMRFYNPLPAFSELITARRVTEAEAMAAVRNQ